MSRSLLSITVLAGAALAMLLCVWLARAVRRENAPPIPALGDDGRKPAVALEDPDAHRSSEEIRPSDAGRVRAPVAPAEAPAQVPDAAILDGRVVEASSDDPVPGVLVRLVFDGATPPELTLEHTTDADGRFSSASTSCVYLKQLLIGSGPRTAGTVVTADLLLRPGSRQEVTARVGAGVTLRGRVVSEDGSPVAGAEVLGWNTLLVQQVLDGRLPADRYCTTDARGSFQLDHLGEHAVLHARAVARVSEDFVFGPVDSAPQDDASLRLRTRCSLEGIVRSPGGEALQGCRVSALLHVQDERTSAWRPMTLVRHNVRKASTDATGRFLLESLTPDRYMVVVEHDAWATLRLEVSLPRTPLELSMEEGERRGGGVLRSTGDPAVGARVILRSRDHTLETEVDLHGDFEIKHVPALELAVLSIIDEHSASFAVPWADVAQGTVIELEEPLSIDGILVDQRGVPLSRTFVYLEGDRVVLDPVVPGRMVPWEYLEPYTHVETDALGKFRLGRLHRGLYRLSAKVPDDPRRTSSWSVPAGSLGITLRISEDQPTATLQGVVVGPAGEAITDFCVIPLPIDELGQPGASVVYSFRDEHGRFEITGLDAGTRMIVVRAEGFEEALLEPAYYPNGVTQLTIELGR
jgi:protocatechuate 3,4-dioxygenase beta subunit